jgi:hypothetical protein
MFDKINKNIALKVIEVIQCLAIDDVQETDVREVMPKVF